MRRNRRANSRISSSRFILSCSAFISFSFSARLSALSVLAKRKNQITFHSAPNYWTKGNSNENFRGLTLFVERGLHFALESLLRCQRLAAARRALNFKCANKIVGHEENRKRKRRQKQKTNFVKIVIVRKRSILFARVCRQNWVKTVPLVPAAMTNDTLTCARHYLN